MSILISPAEVGCFFVGVTWATKMMNLMLLTEWISVVYTVAPNIFLPVGQSRTAISVRLPRREGNTQNTPQLMALGASVVSFNPFESLRL